VTMVQSTRASVVFFLVSPAPLRQVSLDGRSPGSRVAARRRLKYDRFADE